MQSIRRKSMKIETIAVVRSSLIFNPVASVAPPGAVSFSDVLVEADNAPRSAGSSHAFHDEMKVGMETKTSRDEPAHAERSAGWSPHRKNSMDLYVQLDTLLREKSILIAVV